MAAIPRVGMDHAHYDWSPLPSRPRLAWPDGQHVALCILVALDAAAVDPPSDPLFARMAQPPAGTPYPDLNDFLTFEYGLRTGLFRLMRVLDKYAVRASVALDAAVAEHYPFVVQQCRARGWEFVARGLLANYPLGNRLGPADTREYVRRTLHALERGTGLRPRGWFGLDYLETSDTPAALAELGIDYVLDWPNDEQPYPMHVPRGALVSLPTLLELDDAYAQEHRKLTVWRWEQAVTDAFDTLLEEGATSGRLLTLTLHPWVSGQPFRVKSLERVLEHMLGQTNAVWQAPAGEIAAWYARHPQAGDE
jgi:peptidoglycan/xylan/chitin deacetylase (PgdA/CDA1 family)